MKEPPKLDLLSYDITEGKKQEPIHFFPEIRTDVSEMPPKNDLRKNLHSAFGLVKAKLEQEGEMVEVTEWV